MHKEIMLLRHAKSDWSANVSDFERPIIHRGKRAAQRMGAWLAFSVRIPDQVISSPARRAKITAEKLIKAMGQSTAQIHYDKRLYHGSVDQIYLILQELPEDISRIILIGHNPAFESCIMDFSSSTPALPADGKLIPTASLALFHYQGPWSELHSRQGDFQFLKRPDSLPKLFHFPFPDGHEQRKRPAYYYRQSAVIPYRFHQGQLQIMLVLTRKKKRWTIPKGIHEPGMEADESAAKEAFEEAGIKGMLDHIQYGEYTYHKWGALSHVKVYAIHVNEVLPKQQWTESHRGRAWLSLEQALKKIHQQKLIPILQHFAGSVHNMTDKSL